jgi:hypothetical protein
MVCGGPCSDAVSAGVTLVAFSPLLLIISTICGWFTFLYPTWGRFSFVLAPPALVALGLLLASNR